MDTKNNKEKVLEVSNLRQYFDVGAGSNRVTVKAVHNVSFDIYRGEVFGLVGESGCGKTTTGRSIIHLYKIVDGDVYFLGQKISSGTREKRRRVASIKKEVSDKKRQLKSNEITNEECNQAIQQLKSESSTLKKEIREAKIINENPGDIMSRMQMIFQDPIDSLNPRMTVKEIIAEGLIIRGIKDQKVLTEKVNEMLNLVGLLPEHATRYPHEFSGGQRQRIGIARALIVNPELIIADEPISALDVSIQAQVINLLNDLKKQFNLTILFIAHNLSVVRYFCDRIGVMYYGRIVEMASTEELFAHPLHPYTKALFSAVPLPDPDYEKNRKRMFYNPNDREFTEDKPLFVEITPGHFVRGTFNEIEKYKKELAIK